MQTYTGKNTCHILFLFSWSDSIYFFKLKLSKITSMSNWVIYGLMFTSQFGLILYDTLWVLRGCFGNAFRVWHFQLDEFLRTDIIYLLFFSLQIVFKYNEAQNDNTLLGIWVLHWIQNGSQRNALPQQLYSSIVMN